MSNLKKVLFCISALCLLTQSNFAQNTTSSDRPSFNISQLASEPVIDGNVLNDELWKTVTPITEMTQIKPKFNVPASEKTEIRVAYSKGMFYVAVVCYDTNPETIVVSDSRRDSDLNDEDSFLFIIDTYNDQQNGFLFGTNSNAMEYDAQIITKVKVILVRIDNKEVLLVVLILIGMHHGL